MLSGLGLIHPGFLAAGLAVAVPIVIHLLLRAEGTAGRDRVAALSPGGPARPGSPPQAPALGATVLSAWPAWSCSLPSSPVLTGA